jgi:THUMP domain-containing protein
VSYRFTVADVGFLTSPAGAAAVAEVGRLPLTSASYLADVRSARAIAGERAGAVLETVLLRRRAVSKVDDPGRWLFTDGALQQATPAPVARHRAGRFAGRDVHDVTCSVGVDLAALSAVARRCVGSDLDPVRLAMARHNCGLPLVRADALRPVSRGTAVLADPGRRDAAGRRRWRPADFTPTLDALADAYRDRDLAVKCAPGIDLADVPWAGEVELISLDGQVREACLWAGSLATAGVRRRATVLRAGCPAWTVTDAEPDVCPVRPAGEWIIDPDGAVVRAGLVRHYAARHGLGQLDERIAYLTGDAVPSGLRAFRVLEQGHYSEKALRVTLRRLGVGRVEILVRGLDIDPNTLRPRLKLRGDAEASVVLTRIGRTPTAFVCRAERT